MSHERAHDGTHPGGMTENSPTPKTFGVGCALARGQVPKGRTNAAASGVGSSSSRLRLPADIAKHVGMNIQADVGHVTLLNYRLNVAGLPIRRMCLPKTSHFKTNGTLKKTKYDPLRDAPPLLTLHALTLQLTSVRQMRDSPHILHPLEGAWVFAIHLAQAAL